ncbi:Integrase core domain protein [Planococcus antarcticus DSM 14505]|uniref:Integrase core domain protein n=1 Tax=Planococcus antarcticus DSM 14505 TaxID=1185653 RepID=A0AA87ILT6_9BACL|nr:Integrase core domain protein [Planococcus antarcticus DSM 14505]
MTYTHLTTDELVMIESYHRQHIPVAIIAECLNRSRQPIYNVINFLKSGYTALDFYKQYKKNKHAAADENWSCRRTSCLYSRQGGAGMDA